MDLGELIDVCHERYYEGVQFIEIECLGYCGIISGAELCKIVYPGGFISYRGFYDSLAILASLDNKKADLGRFIGDAENALGNTFTGYKGGEYQMSRNTSIYVVREPADNSGIGIVAHRVNMEAGKGTLMLQAAYVDDYLGF